MVYKNKVFQILTSLINHLKKLISWPFSFHIKPSSKVDVKLYEGHNFCILSRIQGARILSGVIKSNYFTLSIHNPNQFKDPKKLNSDVPLILLEMIINANHRRGVSHWDLDTKASRPLKEKPHGPATFTLFLCGYWQNNLVSQSFV